VELAEADRAGWLVAAHDVRPLTHAPETGTIISTPDSGASFSCRGTTSNVVDCLRILALNYRHMAPICGACQWR